MKQYFAQCSIAVALLGAPAGLAEAADLRGSPASMANQHAVAVEQEYSFSRTPADVGKLVAIGGLVPVAADDVTLNGVSYPYARPEVRSFVEHLATRFATETTGRLVVTSLTRPGAAQPSNAHKLSVHPAGMAVDFRVPADAGQRAWLERTLLGMEQDGLLDVTRERSPAHYHVAVFPEAYRAYAATIERALPVVQPAPFRLSAPASVSAAVARLAPGAGVADPSSLLLLLAAAALLGSLAARWLGGQVSHGVASRVGRR